MKKQVVLIAAAVASTPLVWSQFARAAPPRAAGGSSSGPVSVSASSVDKDARALWGQVLAAYRGLHAYSGTVDLVTPGASRNGVSGRSLRAAVLLRRPAGLRVRRLDSESSAEIVGDDERVQLFGSPSARLAEAILQVPPGTSPVATAFGRVGLGESTLGFLLSGEDPLTAHPGQLRTLWIGNGGLRAGIPVEKLTAVWGVDQDEETITYVVGKADHLLREVTTSRGGTGAPITRLETMTEVHPNPDLPQSAFQRPQPSSPAAAPSPTDTASSAKQAGATRALPGTAVPASAEPPAVRYDFGKQSLLDSPRVEHAFRFRNDTGAPLRLERIATSCGCTSAVLGAEGTATSPTVALPTLAPNQETFVRATVDLTPLQPGQVLKSVTLYAAGSRQPVARFEVTGVLLPTVTFSPALLDFGRVEAGQPRAIALTAHIDPRVERAGALPNLRVSNPAVHLQPLGLEEVPGGPVTAGMLPGMKAHRYLVTVDANAPLGVVDGGLEFAPAVNHDPAQARVDLALRSAKVQLAGQVVGAVTAQPQVVAFGIATHGRPGLREVTLVAEDAAVFKKVEVTSESPWIQGQLVQGTGSDPRVRVLQVQLRPEAPPGVVRQRLTLRFANGQRMLLPLTAYVRPDVIPNGGGSLQ